MLRRIEFPSPHPGIINFFWDTAVNEAAAVSFRPLIRGLSISSMAVKNQ